MPLFQTPESPPEHFLIQLAASNYLLKVEGLSLNFYFFVPK